MKAADELKARLGANMRESMGPTGPKPAAPSSPAVLHGATDSKYQGASRLKDALAIEVGRLMPDPDQPRKEFDPAELDDLAASLKARGQLQPIRVRWEESAGRWLIIAGERRYRAALLAELPTLVCIEAKGELDPDDILEDQLVENCLRSDLKPMEQARAFRTLIDRRGWSYRRLAESLHIAPASVVRALALLELPTALQDRVEGGELAPSVAYEVSKLEDSGDQTKVAARAVAENLSRAEVVQAVRETAAKTSADRRKSRGGKPAPRKTSATVRTATGGKVTFEHRRGVDDSVMLAALLEAVEVLRGRLGGMVDAA
jgi:ParB family transcriptional regulator, chromosome partitioning protein